MDKPARDHPDSSSFDPRSDAALLRSSGRDAAAFGVFYDRHESAVTGYFARRTADRSLALELMSETFAQAFAARHRYRRTDRPATAWLFTIAARQLNEYHRQQRVSTKYREKLGVPAWNLDSGYDRVDDLDELRSWSPRLEAALASLTPASAEAVTLRVGQGWSYPELAEHLGCTPATARVRVSRALTRLHTELGDRADHPFPNDHFPKKGQA